MPRVDASARCEPRPLPGATQQLRRHAPLLRALADEARLELVERLAGAAGPVCVCDLIPGLGLSQPTVSHHLKVLRDAGVVRSERKGPWVYYSLERPLIGDLAAIIQALVPAREAVSVDAA